MDYRIPINNKDYHKAILTVLNFNLHLSKQELDIVSTLLNHNVLIVDRQVRDTLRKDLDISKFNTNNYISTLRKKGILVTKPADKKLYLNSGIIDIVKDKKVSFEFILHDNNNN